MTTFPDVYPAWLHVQLGEEVVPDLEPFGEAVRQQLLRPKDEVREWKRSNRLWWLKLRVLTWWYLRQARKGRFGR